MQTCPKCGYVRKRNDTAPDWQCPSCQIVYAKFGQQRQERPASALSEPKEQAQGYLLDQIHPGYVAIAAVIIIALGFLLPGLGGQVVGLGAVLLFYSIARFVSKIWQGGSKANESRMSTKPNGVQKTRFGFLKVVAGVIGAALLFAAGGAFFEGKNAGHVEASQNVTVEALARYKAKYGRFPGELGTLVPEYLAEIPKCPDSSRSAAYYLDPKSGEFELGCPTFMFARRQYSSARRVWESQSD